MSAELLREAAAKMREHAGGNDCGCGDEACVENWYPRWVSAVADWLDVHGDPFCRSCEAGLCPALAVASAYLGRDA